MAKRKYDNTQTSTQPDASDRLLPRSEVAQYLNIGTTFIEQLRRQGKLPSYRLSGNCIRYKKSDCDALLDHSFVVRPAKSKKRQKDSNEH
ncbi:MAG: helix-turn-helix domain-containing protein [Opitutales bacterium]|nr:helix-turn-helix domain-containing protein [Opitutales bacterium]